MIIYKDGFSSEEIVSNAFKFEWIYDNAGIKIKSKYISKGEEKIDIGCGDAFGGASEEEKAEDQAAKVIDVIDIFKYQETVFTKKDYQGYIKAYMKKVVDYLTTKKPERVDAFKKGATEMVKFILSKYDEFTFYTPESYDMENSIILSYYDGEDATPTFIIFMDGLRPEKY